MVQDVRNLWAEIYGVSHDPFATQPISAVKGGLVPKESFMGRTEEMKRILKVFSYGGGSRMIVTGDIGVGKTTFVNVARMRAMDGGIFTPFSEIGVQEGWGPDCFVMNTLEAIYSTLSLMGVAERPINQENYKKLDEMLQVTASDRGYSLMLAGFGGGYNSSTRPPRKIPFLTIFNFFKKVVGDIIKKTNNDIIIHYNNLENIPQKEIVKIFENLRDFFQTPRIHFVFVGNTVARDRILSVKRFSSTLTDTPFILKPQSSAEIDQIIKKRFEYLKVPGLTPIVPYHKDALTSLHALFDGNIREILNSLSTAVKDATEEKHVMLNKDILARTLRNIAEKRYLAGLTVAEKKILKIAILKKKFTNSELSRDTGLVPQNISHYLKRLKASGCIQLKMVIGREKFFEVQPHMKWLLLETSSEFGQRSIIEF